MDPKRGGSREEKARLSSLTTKERTVLAAYKKSRAGFKEKRNIYYRVFFYLNNRSNSKQECFFYRCQTCDYTGKETGLMAQWSSKKKRQQETSDQVFE